MGRVEVRRNNGTWGTVCDDSFGTSDASIFCRALGFDGALCVPYYSRFGPGTGNCYCTFKFVCILLLTIILSSYIGPIWLDDLNCPSSAEIIEDCSHPGWGVHNCGHSEDAGVICQPGK